MCNVLYCKGYVPIFMDMRNFAAELQGRFKVVRDVEIDGLGQNEFITVYNWFLVA